MFHSQRLEEDGSNKRLIEIELAKLMVLHRQILFSLAIAAIAEAILMWTSAEQVSSLHRDAVRFVLVVTSPLIVAWFTSF